MGQFKGGFLMFVDFNKTFNKKKQNDIKVPNALAEYLSEKLPNGLKYNIKEDMIYAVPKEGERISFGGLSFTPTEEQRKILGKNPTNDEILEYSYNSQCEVPIKPKRDDNIIKLNGDDFLLEKLAYQPMLPIKKNSTSFFIKPLPFSKTFSIYVGNSKYSKKLIISRIPNQSIYIAKYTSETNKPLYIEYLLDNRNCSITSFKMSFNLLYAETIKDIVETTVIFNAFTSGNGYIGKQCLNNICDSNAVKYDEKIIVFWEKLLKLEDLLNIQFTPPKEDLNFEEMCLAEELYQNLVKEVPIRGNEKITSINGEWEMKNEAELNSVIGKSLFLHFEGTFKCTLLEQTIELPCIIGVFNSKLSKYDKNNEKYKIYIEDESPENQSYMSSMCFKTKSELQIFKNKEFSDKIEIFRNAKKSYEYLK